MYQGISLEQAPPEDIPIRFFLTAPLGLFAFGGLTLWKGAAIYEYLEHFHTLGLVHAITLGWLAMIMMGAFYQMIPVMIGGTVPLLGASRWVHALVALGSLLLGIFFYSGQSLTGALAFWGLGVGFGLFLWQINHALSHLQGTESPTISAMRTAAVSLGVTIGIGLYMLGTFLGYWEPFLESYQTRYLHLMFGLIGWVLMLVMGVSFHIVPMFFVTPTFPQENAYRVIRLFRISLFLSAVVILMDWGQGPLVISLIFGIAGVALYLNDLWYCLRQRKRKRPDATIEFIQLSGAALLLGGIWFGVQLWFAETRGQMFWGALFLLGFGVSVTMGMLLKIFPFLIWFHRFSPWIGIRDVPMVDQLIPREQQHRLHRAWLLLLCALLPSAFFLQDIALRMVGVGILAVALFFSWLLFQAWFQEAPRDTPAP